jgi:hypothetical protein
MIIFIVTNRPIEDWNVSEMLDMTGVFSFKYSRCNPNLAKWDVSKVTTFVSALQ